MPVFYLRAFTFFIVVRALSVLLHYLGPSPWGGPLVLRPDRFVPEALVIEVGIWGAWCCLCAGAELALTRSLPHLRPSGLRILFLTSSLLLLLFSQIDFEVVRWLGQHMSASYIKNFAGARDGQLFARILKGDKLFSSIALLQMIVAVVGVVFVWLRFGWRKDVLDTKRSVTCVLVACITLLSPLWLRPSEKRWRRVEPATWGILSEGWAHLWGAGLPQDPRRAHQDLIDLVYAGRYDANAKPADPRYPLYRDDNVGKLSPAQFRARPATEKPDVIVIVFETMRGFNTGFMGSPDGPMAAMPELGTLIRHSGRYYPRMHSAGYPSVAGAMGMHLGVWDHHTKITFSSYLHIRTKSFVELLNDAGYDSLALLGADPSFSNFTPWFRRWYETVEYKPENHHDGPLVDRFLALYKARENALAPQMMTLWTATTHPPYDVPPETGIKPAATNEERYLQAMRYADSHLARLVRTLQESPRWDRTLVFILGDHAQPTPWQWTHTDTVGELNPGHTWTALGILGGEDVAPTPGRDDRAVSHVDLAPTILSALDLRAKNHFFGQNLLAESARERPVWAFRYGALSHEEGNTRTILRIDDASSLSYRFEPENLLSYGALEGGALHPGSIDQELAERHRDVARAWAQLLDEDRVAAPEN